MLERLTGLLGELIYTLPAILVALTFHEYAHGWVSYKQGDPTARNLGRLTLNPIKHIDPIGLLCMIVAHVGWAKPVPVNPRYYKNPRRGMALTALAGPLMNIIIAFIAVFLYCAVAMLIPQPEQGFGANLYTVALKFLAYFISINVGLGVFNLIPIPPFDGSRIAFVLLPDKFYFGVMKYERYIMLVMLLLLCTGVLSTPISWLAGKIINGMLWLATSFFSLFI